MGFIDGTNLLRELAKDIGIDFRADKPPEIALNMANYLIRFLFMGQEKVIIRKYWFASYQGSEEDYKTYAKCLRKYEFEPVLFKKNEGREKGVDIALATEMLVNAFNKNYETGIIVAGDKDYLELVKEVKRFGIVINGAFFQRGLSEDLQLAVDHFTDLNCQQNDPTETKTWKDMIKRFKEYKGITD
jgi:uncharacterized LabA/DUF88 family protein